MQSSTSMLGFLALLCIVHFSEGQLPGGGALECFECDTEVTRGNIPLPCTRTRVCDSGKFCRVKVEEKEGGRVLRYRYGCDSFEKCSRRNLVGKEVCMECCTTNGCNTRDTVCQSIDVARSNIQNRTGIFRVGGPLQCLDCDMEVNRGDIPLPCTMYKDCGTGKFCRVKVEEKEGGRRLRYRYGCESIEKCSSGRMEDKEVCRECCTTDGCNTHATLCPSIGDFSQGSGPQCFHCNGEIDIGESVPPCSKSRACDSDEYCRLQITSVNGKWEYNSGCERITNCNSGNIGVCNECCSTDGCNTQKNLCQSLGSASDSPGVSSQASVLGQASSTAGISTTEGAAPSITTPQPIVYSSTSVSSVATSAIGSQSSTAAVRVTSAAQQPKFSTVSTTAESCKDSDICTGMKSVEGLLDCQRSSMATLCKFSCGNCPAPAFNQASSTAHISSTEGAAPSITTPQPTAAVHVTSVAQQPKFSTVSTTEGAAMTDFQTTEVHTCVSIIRQFSCDADWVAELCPDDCQI